MRIGPSDCTVVAVTFLLISCSPAATDREFTPVAEVGAPIVTIGVEDGAGVVFGSIGDVAVRADGSILVADPVSARIWHLTEQGTLIASFGGRGDGPGELQSPIEVALLPSNEYVILDADRFRLTRVRIRGTEHEYAGDIPIAFQALHLCSQGDELILDPYAGAHALTRIDLNGTVITEIGPLPVDLDPSFGEDGQEFLRNRLGTGVPICSANGDVAFLPEWDPTIHVFARDGVQESVHTLSPHTTLEWRVGDAGRPDPVLSPEGWVHRAVSFNPMGTEFLVAQLAAFDGSRGSRDADPIELRVIRRSDGGQARIELTLPRLAYIDNGEAWAWSNVPYPHVVRIPFRIVER